MVGYACMLLCECDMHMSSSPHRFSDSNFSDCSQSLKILLPWNVFSVSDLNTTSGRGVSTCRGA